MSGAAIVLDRTGFSFGDTSFAFDCRVAAGSVAAVLGPSGAGKSTLLNLVAGFDVPDRGRVLIGGADVTGVSPAQRPVSMVFQENNLFAHLDVTANVGLGRSPGLRLTPADREAVRLALEAEDIEARPLWKPMHLQPIFASHRTFGGEVGARLFERGLCLPSGSSLTDDDQDRVVATVLSARRT